MKNKNRTPARNLPLLPLLAGLLAITPLASCRRNYIPKPDAYFRIDFPEKSYRTFSGACPFSFEYPTYATLTPDIRPTSEPCWFNINIPAHRATIYLTYRTINEDFDRFVEENWKIIYDGIAQKADAVDDENHGNIDRNAYGTIFNIRGNAASSVQFFVTDSVNHFLRGSLYFNVKPNEDSLAPAINFFRKDIVHLMQTVRWKNTKID